MLVGICDCDERNVRLIVKGSYGEVGVMSEDVRSTWRQMCQEASDQVRRSPNSRNEVFGPS